MHNVLEICRICLIDDNKTLKKMYPLFENTETCTDLCDRIIEVSGVELKEQEEFPKRICEQCVESLNTAYEFRILCQTSEQNLLDIYVKPKSEPPDATETLTADPQSVVFFDMNTDMIGSEDIDLISNNGKTMDDNDDDDEDDDVDLDHHNENLSNYDYDSTTNENKIAEIPSPKKKVQKKYEKTKKAITKTRKRQTELVDRKNSNTTIIPEKKNIRTSQKDRNKKNDVINENIMCEICGNTYLKPSLLKLHMRRHNSEKPFTCEICGKSFACSSEISRHMRVHTGEKPFSCKFCGRTFADRSTNIKHERIHTNTRPFSCHTCGKSFMYSNVLKNHMLTHTGEKRFPCLPCGKTFSRKHQLDQHLGTQTHHLTIENLKKENPIPIKIEKIDN